ncbi:hypothetical protein CTEN210_11732 [Chaetoceros tenuissimus]|uniref:Uncharacterized protein n=1 Tax=Chaetoceros tenuissimus TaxID=426638 RepID=A0AAD3CZX6_9STRA|nr:hypothetical protein CTEN210_11732 [Chaetoceros tenuissimus]
MIQPKSISKTVTKRPMRKLATIALSCISALIFFTSTNQKSIQSNIIADFQRQLRYNQSSKNLLIINGLNKEYMLEIAAHNRLHSFTSQDFDCVIFSDATYEEIKEDHHILKNLKEMNCNIMRLPDAGFGDFLLVVNPTFVNNYDTIALMAADTYFPEEGKMALKPQLVMEKMKELEIGSVQPIVIKEEEHHMEKLKEGCITSVNRIPTMAQFFSREAWACYYNMLHYSGSTGGCYDLCTKKVCPDVKQAIDGRYVGYQIKNSQQVEAMEQHDYFVKKQVSSSWLEVVRKMEIQSSLELDMEQNPLAICEKYECGASTETAADTDIAPLWCEATIEDAETLGSSR